MANIILEHLPSLRSRLAPQSVGDVLAHTDVPARRKRGRPAQQAKDPKKRDGGKSLKYSTFQQKWKASYPWLMLLPVVAVCPTDGRDECPGCTNCCVMACSVCVREKASNNFTAGGGTGVFTERGLELHQRTCHTAGVNDAASAEDSAVSPVGEAAENEEGARGFDGTHSRST
jgi:hypothetical protein